MQNQGHPYCFHRNEEGIIQALVIKNNNKKTSQSMLSYGNTEDIKVTNYAVIYSMICQGSQRIKKNRRGYEKRGESFETFMMFCLYLQLSL